MVGVLFLLGWVGCSSPEPAPTPLPEAPARGKAAKPSVRAKAKTGNMVHGKAKAKGKAAKAPRGRGARRPPPVGGAGEVKGHLVLEVAKPEGEGATPKARTQANMVLAWGEGSTALVRLGEVEGTCTSVEPKPVGPEGRQHQPIWTVSCTHDDQTDELYILQSKSLLAVVRGTPGPTGERVYKPVRRVPLQPSAKLVRSDEPAPEVASEEAPAPSGAQPEPAAAPAPSPADAPAPEAPAPDEPAPVPAAPEPDAP